MSEPEPMDVYVDKGGTLWRCIGVMLEPAVILQEISPEARTHDRMTLAISSPNFRDMVKVQFPKLVTR